MNVGIRLLSIKIKNIKNVKQGYIEFKSKKQIEKGLFDLKTSDVIGIYGPNGSSKTAVVNAFNILKNIIVSRDDAKVNHFDEKEVYDIINKNENEATLELTYLIDNVKKMICIYEVVLGKNDSTKIAFIKSEKLSYKLFSDELDKWNSKVKLVEVDFMNENLLDFIQPLSLVTLLKKYDKTTIGVLQRLVGSVSSNNSSFIFSDIFISTLYKIQELQFEAFSLKRLKIYATHNMHVYDNKEISQIAAMDAIPFLYRSETEKAINTTFGKFSIFGESILSNEVKPVVFEYFKEIDIVINKIVPNMHVSVIDLGNAILENGVEGFRCEVVSIRNDLKIPLGLESDGIKKIISLISAMVDVFNNKSSILIVDEFDSGIFEYLLGELLKGFKEEAKGQFLFTSHNLRALEVIKDSIVFSSLDENNKYITYPRLSKTENLRSQYLRKLFLDSDNNFSEQIDLYDIYRSFVKAGELIKHE